MCFHYIILLEMKLNTRLSFPSIYLQIIIVEVENVNFNFLWYKRFNIHIIHVQNTVRIIYV